MLASQVDLDLAAAQALFERHAAAVTHIWMTATAAPAEEMARVARSADLIVAGGAPLKGGGGVNQTAATTDLIMLSGRPVLVAPVAGGRLRGKQVIVAWKDTREARRAVADSVPLLKLADEVTVVEVCSADDLDGARQRTLDVAQHLQRHGIAARPLATVAPPERAALELADAAKACDADLIVSGAYGHARLQEWALGGVTRELLQTSDRFLLLSH